MDSNLVKKSKFLSRVLRHRPDTIGVQVDKEGWCDVTTLLTAAERTGVPITYEELKRIVADNDKSRFSLDEARHRIRAVQGHSIDVNLKLPAKKPPPVLYHGTVDKFLSLIKSQGLLPGTRRDVHLSADRATALSVGARRGKPVVLVVETYALVKDGFVFRQAENGVWLTSAIPAKYIRFPE